MLTKNTFFCEHVFSDSGELEESTMRLSFNSKEILNSNSLPRNTFFLSKLKKNLRDVSSNYGMMWHTNPFVAQTSCEYVGVLSEKKLAKSRARKEMNKDKVDKSGQSFVLSTIDDSFEEKITEYELFLKDNVKENILYDKCSISVGVSPPTKRLCDPPNYYPTVKPIIDGLTDSLWWEDDNFNHIQKIEFYYIPTVVSNFYTFDISVTKNK